MFAFDEGVKDQPSSSKESCSEEADGLATSIKCTHSARASIITALPSSPIFTHFFHSFRVWSLVLLLQITLDFYHHT
jgi:hypothetical protein